MRRLILLVPRRRETFNSQLIALMNKSLTITASTSSANDLIIILRAKERDSAITLSTSPHMLPDKQRYFQPGSFPSFCLICTFESHSSFFSFFFTFITLLSLTSVFHGIGTYSTEFVGGIKMREEFNAFFHFGCLPVVLGLIPFPMCLPSAFDVWHKADSTQ